MSIAARFQGKRVLITGTTGFLGKVLLQKFLYSLSCVEKIYVLIRGKEGSNLQERFKKQIVSSPCFDRLRSRYGNRYDEFFMQKVQPIKGDLQKDQLGMSNKDYEQIIQNCQVIINCAASIDFNARIDFAIDSNIRGSLRMLDLAKKVKKLEIFTHISTCYVNCNLKGLIKEQIYEKQNDPQIQLKSLLQMPQAQLISKTDKILGPYPNTYTYTKSLCERLMKKRKGDTPLCIVRPAIINTSYSEPFPGWLDSIAAAAALYLFVGLGIVQQVKGNAKIIGDTVPVDMVVANIIVASAYNFRNKQLMIYHSGSSDRNPLTWGEIKSEVEDYWNANKSYSKVDKASLLLTENELSLKIKKWKRKLPIWMYSKIAPAIGKQSVKNAAKMEKTILRGQQITKIFQFFVLNQWIYQCKNMKKLTDFLTPQEKNQYILDAADIDMKYFLKINNYGLQKYILKESPEIPSSQNSNLLKMREQSFYFSDINWALNTDIPLNKKQVTKQMRSKILSSTRVLAVIDYETKKRQEQKGGKIEKIKQEIQKQATMMIQQIIGEIKLPVIRFLAWTLHKVFRRIYEKINISMQMLNTIRQIEQNMNIPIVLLPTHRSYIDFMVVSYIFFVYKLKLPYIVSDQALLNANLIPFLIKSSGAFFFKKEKYKNSRLYHIIFDKYVQLLLREGNNLEFFIQGTRSRTGKILAPQFQILNIVVDTVIFNKVADVCLVPLTINYQKVLQGDTFPTELLGQQKVHETLFRVVKAVPLLKTNYGRVYVQICKPIFVKQFYENIKHSNPLNLEGLAFRQHLVQRLGREIIICMTQKIVIMSTAIVSSVLLMNRKGISQDMLIKAVNQISKYILKKGYKIGGINQNSSTIAVRNAIGYLSQITTKTKKNIFELQIIAGNQFQKILMLSYYRNTLTHAFLPEAFIGCVMASFGNQLNVKEGITLARLHEQSNFLATLLKGEYNIEYSLERSEEFLMIIDQMQKNLVLDKKEEDKVIISSTGDRMIGFYCSLLRSQIQCYWASLVYIITICKSNDQKHQTRSLQNFFDTVQWFMESLYEEKVIEDYQACSLQSIKNAFQTYENRKLIKLTKGGKKKQSVVEVIVTLEDLEGLENQIKFFRKSVYHNSVLSPMDVAKSSLKDLNLSKL